MVRKLLKLNVLFSLTLSLFAFSAEAPKGPTLNDLPPEVSAQLKDQIQVSLLRKLDANTSVLFNQMWGALRASNNAELAKVVGGDLAEELKDPNKLGKLQDAVKFVDLAAKGKSLSVFMLEGLRFEKNDGDVFKNQNLKILFFVHVTTETEEKGFHVIFETSATSNNNGKVFTANSEAQAVIAGGLNATDIKITEFRPTDLNDESHTTKEDIIAKDWDGIKGIEEMPLNLQIIPVPRRAPAPNQPSPPKSPSPKGNAKPNLTV